MMDLSALRAEQLARAADVICYDDFSLTSPCYIAGADVGFEQQGAVTRAVIAVLHYPSLALVEYQIARIDTSFPYIPGYLSFREYPALLAAWHKLQHIPELVFVDGQGIAHPRRLGIASHFGLLIDKPTIGVAKKRLCGQFTPLEEQLGACSQLADKGQQIGWVWRSKVRCNPLFISPGHRIGFDSALNWVKACMGGYRLPEPTRWADAIASQRPAFLRWQQQQS